MHFSTTALLSLATAALAVASPLNIKRDNDTIQDWQVTSVGTGSPSGRPGNSRFSSINATVYDPSTFEGINVSSDDTSGYTFTPSTGFNCFATWYQGENPYGRTWPCQTQGGGGGFWVFHVIESTTANPSPTTNFDLKFTRYADTVSQGAEWKRVWEGQAHFQVGVNMAGTCGGSGVCGWGLKPEAVPVLIQQTDVTSSS